MTASETFDGLLGMKLSRRGQKVGADLKSLEYFMASGLGSRGGPNKASNKWRSSPQSYLADSLEDIAARLADVLLPALEREVAGIETSLEELEQHLVRGERDVALRRAEEAVRRHPHPAHADLLELGEVDVGVEVDELGQHDLDELGAGRRLHGGGDCGSLREVLKHSEVEQAIQIEIDELWECQVQILFQWECLE